MSHIDVSVATSPDDELERHRANIDTIDNELLALIHARVQEAREIGQLKRHLGHPVYQPGREAAILRKLCAQSGGTLREQHIASIWRALFQANREVQQTPRVAFLGPRGTYTEQAMQRYFGTTAQPVACDTLDAVFASLADGRAERAVVPIENSTEGTVMHTVDLLIDAGVQVSGEVVLPVSHCLLSASGSLQDVDGVLGHEQALAQCRDWLDTHLPGVRREARASNAAAARQAVDTPACAAIASEQAAHQYGLQIVARAIQDQPDNRTRFLVLGGSPPEPTGYDRTSLVVELSNQVGSLAQIFDAIARHRISVLWLETRPRKTARWAYHFIVDLLGHHGDRNVAAAIEEIRSIAEHARVLGSYPCAPDADPALPSPDA
ncbi:prephenate dehydratase [Paraburkholderia megapolitana]|uniref:prephenate dehydratase n=1 Tax=Paraburkholderia megapolitana TaxID=420953 RepID=UPI0038B98CF7